MGPRFCVDIPSSEKVMHIVAAVLIKVLFFFYSKRRVTVVSSTKIAMIRFY